MSFPGVVGKYILMVRSFVGFFVATAIIFCWVGVYCELRKQRKIHSQNTQQTRKTWHKVLKRKVAIMFFCVVISLYLCYAPLWVRAVAHYFDYLKFPQYEVFAISLVLANSSMNPIIYSFTSKIFRDELFGRRSTPMENAD